MYSLLGVEVGEQGWSILSLSNPKDQAIWISFSIRCIVNLLRDVSSPHFFNSAEIVSVSFISRYLSWLFLCKVWGIHTISGYSWDYAWVPISLHLILYTWAYTGGTARIRTRTTKRTGFELGVTDQQDREADGQLPITQSERSEFTTGGIWKNSAERLPSSAWKHVVSFCKHAYLVSTKYP